jgi:hypothetical protein
MANIQICLKLGCIMHLTDIQAASKQLLLPNLLCPMHDHVPVGRGTCGPVSVQTSPCPEETSKTPTVCMCSHELCASAASRSVRSLEQKLKWQKPRAGKVVLRFLQNRKTTSDTWHSVLMQGRPQTSNLQKHSHTSTPRPRALQSFTPQAVLHASTSDLDET